MPDMIHETLARLERKIAEDKIATHESADRVYELDYDTREAIQKLWNDHAARVAPLLAARARLLKALATVRSYETPAPLIVSTR